MGLSTLAGPTTAMRVSRDDCMMPPKNGAASRLLPSARLFSSLPDGNGILWEEVAMVAIFLKAVTTLDGGAAEEITEGFAWICR